MSDDYRLNPDADPAGDPSGPANPTQPRTGPLSHLVSKGVRGGGFATHKPGCRCFPCVARRRKEEAFAERARSNDPEGAIEAQPAPGVDPEASFEADFTGASRGQPKPNAPLSGAMSADIVPAHLHLTKEQGPRDHGPKARKARVAQWIFYRTTDPSLSNKDIAAKIGISPVTLMDYIYKARKQGWLNFANPLDQIEYELVPKVVDNLNYFLDARDRTVTIETAKGTIFKAYAESKGVSEAPTTVLALKIEPAEGGEVKVMVGKIVGTPKGLES